MRTPHRPGCRALQSRWWGWPGRSVLNFRTLGRAHCSSLLSPFVSANWPGEFNILACCPEIVRRISAGGALRSPPIPIDMIPNASLSLGKPTTRRTWAAGSLAQPSAGTVEGCHYRFTRASPGKPALDRAARHERWGAIADSLSRQPTVQLHGACSSANLSLVRPISSHRFCGHRRRKAGKLRRTRVQDVDVTSLLAALGEKGRSQRIEVMKCRTISPLARTGLPCSSE